MSLQKDRLSWAFVGLFLVMVGCAAYFVLWPQLQPHTTLRLGDGVFSARVITAQEYAKNGIQDSSQLADNKAVLHVFDRDSLWPIDMKQRHDLFDIVWLDGDKKVVHIVKNASGDSSPSTVFSSDKDARYMIELSGGTVDGKSIRIGSAAYFDENDIQGVRL